MVTVLLNRAVLLVAALAFVAPAFAQVPAQKVPVNICGAGKTGTYIQVAKFISIALGDVFDAKVYETKGSKENLQALQDGRCQLAIIQADATNWYRQSAHEMLVDLKILSNAYTEQAHLVCSRDLNVKSFADLEGLSKKGDAVIYAGSDTSGGYMTLENLKGMYAKDYAGIIPMSVDDTRNEKGEITSDATTNSINFAISQKACAFFVARAPNKALMALSPLQASKINLVSLDDGKFDRLRDAKNEKIYKFLKFDDMEAIKDNERYQSLRKVPGSVYGTNNVEYTLDIAADVVVNTEWESNMLQGLQQTVSGSAQRYNNTLEKIKLFKGNFSRVQGYIEKVNSQPLPKAK